MAHDKGYYSFESVHIRKDGSRFPVTIELMAVKDENGSVMYRIANVWDITEKKAAEERLLLKKFALDHIHDAVFMIDENANFQYVNEGACTALGYSREEFEHMNVGDVDPDWPAERWSEHWEALKKAGSMTMELRHRRKDGTIFPVEVSANYIQFGDKHYNMAIARDITERRLLEEQKENERMRLFFERQLVGMTITSPTKGWLHTNKKLQEMLGYTHDELTHMTWADLTHPDDLAKNIEPFEKLLNGEINDYMIEKRYIRKDGNIIDTNLSVSCVRNEDGSVNYLLGLIEDITERKRAEEALSAKEREFRSLSENIPDNIARWDFEGHYLYINPVHERTLGISLAEAIGSYLPDEHKEVQKAIAQVAATGETVIVHQQIPNKNGEIEIHDVTLVPERDESGKIISILGIGRDMTGYLSVCKTRLTGREQELRSLADSSPGMMGSFYLRPDGSVCMPYVSPNIVDLFALNLQDVRDDATPLIALNHPDDVKQVAESIAESARTMSLSGTKSTASSIRPKGSVGWRVIPCRNHTLTAVSFGTDTFMTSLSENVPKKPSKKHSNSTKGSLQQFPISFLKSRRRAPISAYGHKTKHCSQRKKRCSSVKILKKVLPPDVVITLLPGNEGGRRKRVFSRQNLQSRFSRWETVV